MADTAHHFFSPCPRGLEGVLAEDLEAAGGTDVRTVPGGAHFRGDWAACYRVNLHSRVATRVLWRVAHGGYRAEPDIHRLAYDQPWLEWFDPRRTIRVYV